MSEIGNVELLRLGFQAFEREGPVGLAPLLAVADPEIELYAGPGLEPSGTYRGHEAAVRLSEEWFEAWDEFHITRLHMYADSDQALAAAEHLARGS